MQDLREVVETWLALAENAREMVRLASAVGAPTPDLEELRQKEEELRTVKAAAEQINNFATRVRPSADPALLEQGRAEIEQGRMKTAAQMRAGQDEDRA